MKSHAFFCALNLPKKGRLDTNLSLNRREASCLTGCQPNGSFQGPGASTVKILLVRCVWWGRTCLCTWPGPGLGPGPWPRLSHLAFRGSWQVGAGPACGAQAGGEGAAWQIGKVGRLSSAGVRLETALGAVQERLRAFRDVSDGFVTLGPRARAGSTQEFCSLPLCPRVGSSPDSPLPPFCRDAGLRGSPAAAISPGPAGLG